MTKTAEIIDGKSISQSLRQQLKSDIEAMQKEGITPGLAVVIVGDDPASKTYVQSKHKACQKLGMHSEVIRLKEQSSEEELLNVIQQLNADEAIHGILVQLPLPKHISEEQIINAIRPEKDVDGFHPVNVGQLVIGEGGFIPCTPHGIIKMMKAKGIAIEGKHAVVIGRSNIVGKPVSLLLLQENATVTMCHSRTKNLAEISKQADILVVALGKAEMIGKEYISPGTTVIDVGINRLQDGRLVGDVNFEEAKQVAEYITPVPGGVGPMTITMLLYNTVEAAKRLGMKQTV